MRTPPDRRDALTNGSKTSGFIGRYLAVVTMFAVLALVLALGRTGWAPTTWMDWLKERGVGRR